MVFRKWGDRPHWEYDAVLVGEDQHGTWIGARAGTPVARPGVTFDAPADFVSVVPRRGAFVATYYREHPRPAGDPPIELYVDITTVPAWTRTGTRAVVTMVDLDLDVVRGRTGRVWVDDEDEFAEHRIAFAYPTPLVVHATHSCDVVLGAVQRRDAPYDGSAAAWLEQVARLRS